MAKAKKAAKKVTKKAVKKVAKKVAPKAKKAKAPKAAKAVKAAKPKSKRKPNPAFMAPRTPSSELAAIVGNKPLPPPQVVKKMWEYIHENKLQDGREIHADDKLKALFGKNVINMFEMMKIVFRNLKV